ncbi:MAG: ATP-binding protein [Bacillota bacterium]
MVGLRGKIMGGYVLITGLALVLSTWSAINYVRLSGQLNAMMVQNYRSVVAASHLVSELERQDSAALLLLLGDGEAEALFESARRDFLGWLARAEANVTLPGEGEVVGRIRALYREYSSGLDALYRAVREGSIPPAAASAAYRARVLPQFDAARRACWDLFRINDQAMVEVQTRVNAASARGGWSVLAGGLAGVALSVLLGLGVSELIARPVRLLSRSARRVGEGHLEERIEVQGRDEVGRLAAEFNAMVGKLRELRASDVAQLAASRHKLQAVIDTISDGLVVTDTALRIESANPVAQEVLGWKDEQVAGRPFSEVVADDRLVELIQRQVKSPPCREEGEPCEPVLMEHKQERGSRFYLADATAVRQDDEVLGVVLLLRDVTAIEEAERSRSQFMSAVSHELRTPLASLTMGIGLLAESKLFRQSPREAELVAILKEDSRRLARLVDELFEIARLRVGRLPMALVRLDVGELVEAATLPFVAQAEAQGVGLRREVPAGLPPVRADREKVTWVISNLVSNALRYTPRGGRITVSAEQRGDRVYISVEDTGIGIPKEKQETIFEPYTQLEDRARGGAGLGLAISRDIVRAHGGRLFVESEPGKGSRFTFSLPVEA